MEKCVFKFINQHQLIKKGATVLVGVSGGADSIALLHFLHSNRNRWEINVVALSVDHQLRGEESLLDLEFVRDICNKWGIPFVSDSLDVKAYKERNRLGTEVAARRLRYQFFSEQMEAFQADYLALGHHGDDQIETMLMSLTRSASSTAFSGIPVKREFSTGWIIRPFLCITKFDIENYCKEINIQPRIDETNFDTTYTRNYFRKYILPLIKEKNSNIHTTIQHLNETLHEDETFLQEEASEMVKSLVEFDRKSNTATFQIQTFKMRPRALQRRALHLILNYLYNDLPSDLSYIHEEEFFSLLYSKKANNRIDFPSQLRVEKSYEKIIFLFSDSLNEEDSTFHQLLTIPGEVTLPDGSVVSAQMNRNKEQNRVTYGFYSSQVALPLHIRTRRPGDRMSWTGLNGSKKIKDIFIDEKIPIDKRNRWPILVDNNGEILWLIGLKKGNPKITQMEGQWIQLQYTAAN
ncbi:tRNA lysidine(34) synthetase TilS [Oceanobacillus sp. Castelsardo]|uniref:tRNA lysidine(34) synthetase TilS n=1 Tax=Oceanobacillus sp. Castelsardo TaxID=1851204 RepID=UPI000838EC80|nr:tRNA lysidine(34) synthetase TilS [Oceanobacillus sp. Castelsardo]